MYLPSIRNKGVINEGEPITRTISLGIKPRRGGRPLKTEVLMPGLSFFFEG